MAAPTPKDAPPRTAVVVIRLTPAERARVLETATSSGYRDFSPFVRDLATDARRVLLSAVDQFEKVRANRVTALLDETTAEALAAQRQATLAAAEVLPGETPEAADARRARLELRWKRLEAERAEWAEQLRRIRDAAALHRHFIETGRLPDRPVQPPWEPRT